MVEFFKKEKIKKGGKRGKNEAPKQGKKLGFFLMVCFETLFSKRREKNYNKYFYENKEEKVKKIKGTQYKQNQKVPK